MTMSPIYDMQMTLTSDWSTMYFLFNQNMWMNMGGGTFFLLLCITGVIVLITHLISLIHVMLEQSGNKASAVTYLLLRGLDYLQMLTVMSTYNLWVIIALCVANGLFSFIFGLQKDKALIQALHGEKVAN